MLGGERGVKLGHNVRTSVVQTIFDHLHNGQKIVQYDSRKGQTKPLQLKCTHSKDTAQRHGQHT